MRKRRLFWFVQLLSKDIQSPREEAFLQLKELNLMLKQLKDSG